MGRGGRGNNRSKRLAKSSCTGSTENSFSKPKLRLRCHRPRRDQFSKERLLQKKCIQEILEKRQCSLNNVVVGATLSGNQFERLKHWCSVHKWQSNDDGFHWSKSEWRGGEFSCHGLGIVLTTQESMKQLPAKMNVFYTGHGSNTVVGEDGTIRNNTESSRTYALLCMWTHDETESSLDTNFDEAHLTALASQVKPNLNDGKKHYGSGGFCVGFGVRAAFERIDPKTLASFGPCVCKLSKSAGALKTEVSDLLQRWTVKAIEDGSARINRVLSGNVIRDGSVMMEAAVSLCHSKSILLRHRIEMLGSSPFTSCYLNANVGLQEEHQEMDASYTQISVPEQKRRWGFSDSPLEFHFRLNKATAFIIPITPKTDLFYSGFFVAHRQVFRSEFAGNGQYYNVSAYGNRRLVQCIQTTLNRI